MIMISQQTIITETVMANEFCRGHVMYRDEFPGNRQLSKVIDYIIQCKKGLVKSINIEYKESKSI